MIMKMLICFLGALAVTTAISSACPSPLDRFVADEEFCAYMVSPPEGETEVFLARYQSAMKSAISFMHQTNQSMSETQAIFTIRSKCDAVLNWQ